ncbi:MAG: signal recognition particle receptor subunit alpha, partial [Nitrospirota bacterium]|nr:signal recognition particle receptor subunit alpha [Nitrospirota bacterium]
MSWIQRLQDGLAKTRQTVHSSLRRMVGAELDPTVIEDVEASLLQADVGIRTVQRFLDEVNSKTGPFQASTPLEILRTLLLDILRKGETEPLEEIIRRGPKPF